MTTGAPKLGIVFRPQFAADRLREAAEAADAGGLDELWLWEDCFDHGGVATAAAALAWTDRLEVGIGVLPVPLRNPALAAMEIASLSGMFPGRVHAGLGHGVLDWMAQVGARVESPMTLLREYVVAVRSLLAGRTVTAEGRYVRLHEVRLGWVPTPTPAVHVGAVRPKTITLAGELGDGIVLTGETGVSELAAARAGYDAARGDRPGRVTVYVPAESTDESDAAGLASTVADYAAAGADAVILEPVPGADPLRFARFAAEQVRPRLG